MWHLIFKLFFTIIFKLLFKLKTEGLENIPKKTNFIAVANHASFMDPLLIGVAIPPKIRWIVLTEIFYTNLVWARWFINKMRALPHTGLQNAIDLLMKEDNIGIFPEGTRTRDGKLNEFKRGAAVLALKTGRPVLPFAIIGAFEAYPRKRLFPRPYPIKIKIGKPIYLLKEFSERIDDIQLQDGIFKMKNSIQEMINNG